MRKIKQAYQHFIHKYQEEQPYKGYLLFQVILPFFLVFLSETMASHSLTGGFSFLLKHPVAYLVNVSIVMASLTIAMIFTKRLGVVLIISFLWFALSFINFVVLFFRVTPFTGSDLLLLKDGTDVISKYLGPVQIILILILVVLLVLLVTYFIMITPNASKITPVKIFVPSIFGSILLAWLLVLAGQFTGFLETEFRELSASYKKNGFYYCFGASMIDVGISKPNTYSTEKIEEIAENNDDTINGAKKYTQDPNVVVVQLESFFNINRFKGVMFDQNPLPNLTRIMNDNPSGMLNVPVVGAGTVNSEFEILTGMNIDDFGIGEYPFKTVVKEQPCESLAYDLKPYGYKAFAIHNNTGDFYERNQVYCNLGFDVFTSVEYMWPTDYTPMDWCKDNILVEQIRTALDSTPAQDLVYTVSVQGHGSYPTDADLDYEKHVSINSTTLTDENRLNQILYYANQIYEMDEFIGDLLDMLEHRDEPTILVMYGDHLPSLDFTEDEFYRGDLYQTEYFIWNNADIIFPRKDIEAFSIASTILKGLEISNGAINAFHQSADSQFEEGLISLEEYMNNLKDLEYDILYGDDIYYNGEYPFETTDLQMGFYPVSISGARLTKDHVLIVNGENFTRYSKILANGTELTTLYLDPETLVAADVTLSPGDSIEVAQASLSKTEPFLFQ